MVQLQLNFHLKYTSTACVQSDCCIDLGGYNNKCFTNVENGTVHTANISFSDFQVCLCW